jgi:hypothetical protein
METIAIHVCFTAAAAVPALVRQWWEELQSKQVCVCVSE